MVLLLFTANTVSEIISEVGEIVYSFEAIDIIRCLFRSSYVSVN